MPTGWKTKNRGKLILGEKLKMTINHVVKCIQALLVALLLGLSTSAYSQGTGVMTVETSPSGTIQIRYFIGNINCPWGMPEAYQSVPVAGGWQIVTSLLAIGPCSGTPPGGPVTMVVDLGNPAPGQYTVTWTFSGGTGYGTRSTSFTITQDGALQLVPAIPTLEPSMIALLALLLAAAPAVGISWRPWRGRLSRDP
jgi:hypothetical protein